MVDSTLLFGRNTRKEFPNNGLCVSSSTNKNIAQEMGLLQNLRIFFSMAYYDAILQYGKGAMCLMLRVVCEVQNFSLFLGGV